MCNNHQVYFFFTFSTISLTVIESVSLHAILVAEGQTYHRRFHIQAKNVLKRQKTVQIRLIVDRRAFFPEKRAIFSPQKVSVEKTG